MAFKNAKQRAAYFAMKKAKEQGNLQPKKLEVPNPKKEVEKLLEQNIPKVKKIEPESFLKLKKLMKPKIKV
jgi:hypothetical protein